MGNLTKNTITRGAVVALALSAGAATTANAAVTRTAGADRYSTATEIFKSWPTETTTAVLAAGSGHDVDALTVAPLAKMKNAPVILVNTNDSTATIVAQFAEFKTVYIANGTGVISPAIEAGLKATGKTVVRLGGVSRTATALNIAKEIGASDSIVVANGDDAHIVDTLSIASIAAAKGMPIFLTSGGVLSAEELAYAKGLDATDVYALGGTTVVPDAAVAGLGDVTRLAGSGRYETNAAVIANFIDEYDLSNIYVASGEDANLIDALAGAPLAGLNEAPIVFAHDSISDDVKTALVEAVTADTEIVILGGTGAVTSGVEKQLKAIQDAVGGEDPDVVVVTTATAAAIKFTTPLSAQAVVGTKPVVTALAVDANNKPVAGAKVTFEVTTPLQSQNPQYKVTVLSDASGIATLTQADGKTPYTRNAADADTIVAYSDANSAIRTDIAKVYWGVKQILAVTADTATPASGGTVTYTVKLTNPITGDAMPQRKLRVIFKENIGSLVGNLTTEGTYATATTSYNGWTNQRLYQDVNGQSNTLVLQTNSDGVSQFTVTGNHEAVTPIVFYDDLTFYAQGLYDSSQYLASFAGNDNQKLDPRELQVEAAKSNFVTPLYTITSNVTENSFSSVSTSFEKGKKYTVTVKKPDGSAYAGGTVNVGIDELLKGFDSRARIIGAITGNPGDSDRYSKTGVEKDGTKNGPFIDPASVSNNVLQPTVRDGEGRVIKTSIKLDGSGVATFTVASDRPDTVTTPTVWVDGDSPALYNGQTNGQFDPTLDTSVSRLFKVTFVKTFVKYGLLTVTDKSATSATINKGATAEFQYRLYDQTNDKSNPLAVNTARMNYVVTNTGSDDLSVDLGVFDANFPNISVSLMDTNSDTAVTIKPGQTRTIAGNVNSAVPTLKITGKSGAAVSVTATAQVSDRDIDGTGKLYTLYTAPSTATAVYTGVPRVQATIKAGTFVGTLDDKVNSVADGIVKLNISADNYIQFSVAGVLPGQASAGSVTTTSKDFTINDFNQATLLTDDVIIKDTVTGLIVGKTASQKLAAVLGQGAAVQVTFDAAGTIQVIKVLYTSGQYDSGRSYTVVLPTVNHAPVVATAVGAQATTVGTDKTVTASFTDADGDALTYTATSSDTSKVTVTNTGSGIKIASVAAGTATITITANDGKATATDTFVVTATDGTVIVPAVTATVTVSAAPAPGSTIVIATLPTGVDGALYTVKVGAITLTYNATAKKFGGVVPVVYTAAEAQAVTVVTAK